VNRRDEETQGKEESGTNRLFSAPLRLCGENDWLVWQLIDSGLPTGGFAHSAGLEAAWQHGEVRNRSELGSFLEASLQQLGRAALPFVTTAFDEPERIAQLDQLCEAFTTNHVANRASRLQGKAFLIAVGRIFADHGICAALSSTSGLGSGQRGGCASLALPFVHFAVVFGAILQQFGVSRDTTMRMFFFVHLRSVLAAAVRLNIVGPMEAQTLQQKLSPNAEQILQRCRSLALDDAAQSAPLLDVWQGAHDRLYSRLFQS